MYIFIIIKFIYIYICIYICIIFTPSSSAAYIFVMEVNSSSESMKFTVASVYLNYLGDTLLRPRLSQS